MGIQAASEHTGLHLTYTWCSPKTSCRKCLLLLLSHVSCVRLYATPETAAHQAPRPWDSPGKNTRVGCHFLLQCMKVKSESEVAQSCLTLSDPMVCSLPGSSVHGSFQARVLEWGAIPFSKCVYSVPESCAFPVTHDDTVGPNKCFA